MAEKDYDFMRQFVAIDENGEMHMASLRTRRLGQRDDLLIKAAGDLGVPIRKMFRLGTLPVHVFTSATPIMSVRLPTLNFSTYWSLDKTEGGTPFLFPVFNSERGIDHAFEWTPPADLGIYFIFQRGMNPYLIGVGKRLTDQKYAAYRLPFPNIYDDARICMGRSWAMPNTGIVADDMSESIAWFNGTKWNRDLLEGRESSAIGLLRFDPDGHQLPFNGEWRTLMPTIAHHSYNWIVALAQKLGDLP